MFLLFLRKWLIAENNSDILSEFRETRLIHYLRFAQNTDVDPFAIIYSTRNNNTTLLVESNMTYFEPEVYYDDLCYCVRVPYC